MIVRLVAKLIALLNSNRRAVEIGAAVAFGLWVALLPTWNLLFFAVVLALFLAKVNLGMAIVAGAGFSLLNPLVDPALDRLGYAVLTYAPLTGVYRTMYAVPMVPFTRFDDSLVTGAFVAGAALFVPVTALSVLVVRMYRRHIHARIANSKVVQAIRALPLARKIAAALAQVRRVWPDA